ncbi:MAG: hypothetical protein VB877_05980 [Pirellulaceae bacterium]
MTRSLSHRSSLAFSLAMIFTGSFSTTIMAAEKLVDQKGTIKKLGSVGFVIVTEQPGTRYAPSNLAKEFQQDQLRVVFSGEVGKIPPNVRLIGTPFKLTAIAKLAVKPPVGVREISGLKPGGPANTRGSANKPTVIKEKAGVTKSFSDKATQEKVLKEVNFEKEILLVFRWAGSGQDRIAATGKKTDKGIEVVFGYSRGLTRDLRRHFKVYAVAKDAKWKVENKGFARPGGAQPRPLPRPRKAPGTSSVTPESPTGLTRTRIRVR